jgi:hypothetical protein
LKNIKSLISICLRFILKEGRLYLNADYLKMIWMSLAEHAVYPQDREQCFRWFAEVRKYEILIDFL